MMARVASPPADARSADVEPPPLAEQPARARHRPDEYATLAALLAILYLVIFGWMLLVSGGVPYVFDNNESFSTLWHARNMLEHDPRQTLLLTDEVFSPHAAAHPFVHTHQGNLPRLFAFVLYLLGARTIEAQIVATTFTAGVLAVGLLYHVLARVASPRFALVAACVFLTDYLFFAQWQVVTYRVWHTVLLFAALACVLGLEGARHRRRWLGLTFVTYLLLFYYELVFVAFVSIFAGLFLLVRHWRRPKLVVSAYAAQAAGAATALAILFVQLVGYLGWDGLREDLYLTYVARNLAEAPAAQAFSPSSTSDYFAFVGRLSATDPSLQAQLKRFYDEHSVIFWWNLVDSRPLRSLQYFVGSLFIWVFQIYTPLLTLLVAIPLGGAALGALIDGGGSLLASRRLPSGRLARGLRLDHSSLRLQVGFDVRVAPLNGTIAAHPPSDPSRPNWSWPSVALAMAGQGPFAVLLFFFLVTLVRDTAYLGQPISRSSFLGQVGLVGGLGIGLAALAGAALLGRVVGGRWLVPEPSSLWRLWLAAALLGLVTFAIRSQASLYDQEYTAVWLDHIEATIPLAASRVAVLTTTLLGVLLAVLGPRRLLGSAARVAARVVPLLACGAVAFAVVYYLAAGYVLTGYLVRFSPLPVYVVDTAIGLAAWIVLAPAMRGVRAARQSASAQDGLPSVVAATLAVPAFMLLVVCWLQVQRTYVSLQPPDQFTAFFKLLAQPPYRGATFAVGMYSASVAWQTDQWAYFDPVLGTANITIKDDQVSVARDMATYTWLADRRTNAAYATPEFYACIVPRSLRTAVDRATGRPDRVPQCGDVPLVARSTAPDGTLFRPTVVARDPSDYDAWAILRLDWQPPSGQRFVDPRDAQDQPPSPVRSSNSDFGSRRDRRDRSGATPPR